MEGLWSNFHPAEQAMRHLIRSGRIGHVLIANAQFTFLADEVRSWGWAVGALPS